MNSDDDGSNGIVYLIGAGPGDPDLITLRGWELLGQADAVIYDDLIPNELIITLPETTRKIYIGKKADKPALAQDDINTLLVKLAKEGLKVAFLKSGDPLVFGRGGEEVEYLHKHRVSYEIVPGVTAAVAGSAYAGIPITQRNLSAYVILAAGHKADEKDTSAVPWELLAKAYNGTIVIYMGVAGFTNIVSVLIDSGMPPDIPSAVIERGTYPTQKVITAPLNELVVRAIEEKIKPPALFVIGNVVDLQHKLDWFGNKPLFGRRIMVMHSIDRAIDMYRTLRQLGAEVLPYPTIANKTYTDDKAWNQLNEHLKSNTITSWLVFTGENDVHYFIEQYKTKVGTGYEIGDIRKITQFKIAAGGSDTANALARYSLKADFFSAENDSEQFAREMSKNLDLIDSTIVRVRGTLADNQVENILSESGANVIPLTVYETFCPVWPDGFKEKLFDYPPDIIVCTGGTAVEGLFKNLSAKEIEELVEEAEIVSLDSTTSAVIKSFDLKVKVEAESNSIPGIIEAIKDHYGRKI